VDAEELEALAQSKNGSFESALYLLGFAGYMGFSQYPTPAF